jgi:small subunit ribosomal protein S9
MNFVRVFRGTMPRRAVIGARLYSSDSNMVQEQMSRRLKDIVSEYEDFNGIKSHRSVEDAQGKNLVQYNDTLHRSPELDRLRVVPKDKAFFMANPPHEEIIRELNDLAQKFVNLPTIPRDQVDNRTTWVTQEEYKSMLGGVHFKPKYYKTLLRQLNRLSTIDPQLMPAEVRDALSPFTKRKSDTWVQKSYPTLDAVGRAIAVGRRKSSSARVQTVKSSETISGQVLVNGKPLNEYFPRLADRKKILYPLSVVNSENKYNIFATVVGGGLSGQSGAIAHGIAKTLVIHNPLLLTRLSRAGAIQRDPRKKERKKPGKPKARKSYTWVKR